MIYVLGMSHAVNAVRAMDSQFSLSFQNWNLKKSESIWLDLNLGSQAPANVAGKAFFIAPVMGWQAQIQHTVTGEQLAASPEYWQLLDGIQPNGENDVVFSFLGGNEYSVLSLIDHPSPYDFYLPDDDRYGMLIGRQPVPLETMQTLLNTMIHGSVAMLTAIRYKLPGWKVVHVMPPPPIASEAQIRRATEDYFRDALAKFGITPLPVRMKVYHLYCQLMQAALDKLNIQTIYPPSMARDEFDALKEEYAFGCTHANEAYGSLVAQQIFEFVKA
jgi:hypothetical protein